jgi:hypothetical protein
VVVDLWGLAPVTNLIQFVGQIDTFSIPVAESDLFLVRNFLP